MYKLFFQINIYLVVNTKFLKFKTINTTLLKRNFRSSIVNNFTIMFYKYLCRVKVTLHLHIVCVEVSMSTFIKKLNAEI